MSYSWLYLMIAIPFGVLGTIFMKLSHGLKYWKPSVCVAIFYSISFIALTLAIRSIDMSIVYGIWSGVGTILIAIVGAVIFNENMSLKKILSIMLIVIGVFGIHWGLNI